VINEAGYSYVYKKAGSHVVKQMVEPSTANDNEIIIKRGLTKDDHVLLTVPTDKTDIKTEVIDGLKPTVAPNPSADTAKGVTLPATKTPAAVMKAPAGAQVVAKPKG
jgi:hypothetical protein